MSDARRFDLEVDALREELRRTVSEGHHEAAMARQDVTALILRFDADLAVLQRQFTALIQQVGGMLERIRQMEQSFTQLEQAYQKDADERPIRQRWFARVIYGLMFVLSLIAGALIAIVWRLW